LQLQPPALYLITDRKNTVGRPLAEVVARALVGAAQFRGADGRVPVAVCLREKDLEGAALLQLGRSLRGICTAAGAAFFVNGRLDVALACDADGVHLPVLGILPQEVRAIAPDLRVGVSTHTSDEVAAAARARADFVVFGPVFETPSKRDLLNPRGVAGLSQITSLGVPVLALGGITVDNAGTCKTVGADGVACIRAVLAADDPARVTAAFLACFPR
jgi:thiamine-phosphate pyrophosphorylase